MHVSTASIRGIWKSTSHTKDLGFGAGSNWLYDIITIIIRITIPSLYLKRKAKIALLLHTARIFHVIHSILAANP